MTAKIVPFVRPTAEPRLKDDHNVTLTFTIRPKATPPENQPRPLTDDYRRRSLQLVDETIAQLREDLDL